MRPRLNDIVAITFLDHVEDSRELLEFVVYGRLSKITQRSYTVEVWAYAAFDEEPDVNVKVYTLVKKAITGIKILTPKNERNSVRKAR